MLLSAFVQYELVERMFWGVCSRLHPKSSVGIAFEYIDTAKLNRPLSLTCAMQIGSYPKSYQLWLSVFVVTHAPWDWLWN